MWSFKRYFQLVFAIWGLLLVVLGPLSQVFIVQPLVNLLLFENGVVTPNYPCFDPRKISQTCDQDVNIDYYFWNITNKDEVCTLLFHPEGIRMNTYCVRKNCSGYKGYLSQNFKRLGHIASSLRK